MACGICPHLLALQKFLFQDISDDPLLGFGLKSPGIFSLKVCSCLFSAYHTLKGEVRAGKISVHAVNWLSKAWSVFANAVKAEAGEMLLETRAFSLANFLDFLINGRTCCPPINSIAHDPQ